MIVFEFKAKGTKRQYQQIDEALRITKFIRNKCLRFWMDNRGVKPYRIIRAEKAPKFYLWGLGTGEFIRRDTLCCGMITLVSLT